MSAPSENNYAMKFKTPEERKKLCDELVAHLESGLSMDCFPPCDADTIERYTKDFPEDFPSDRLMEAKRRGRLFWEQAGKDGTMGNIEGFNASSWKFNLANRYGWAEKREDKVTTRTIEDALDDAEKTEYPKEFQT